MEAQKLRVYNRLLEKIGGLTGEQSLENAMKELVEKTRECYSEDFENINSHDFVKMMTLDGCFIVELLRLHRQSYQVILAMQHQAMFRFFYFFILIISYV